MAHRVDRVRLVIVSSETKPLPTTPVIETLPRYELYIWTMQARDNNKTCAAATVAQSAWFGSGASPSFRMQWKLLASLLLSSTTLLLLDLLDSLLGFRAPA